MSKTILPDPSLVCHKSMTEKWALDIKFLFVNGMGTDPNAIGQMLKDLGLAMGAVLIANASDDE